MRCTGQKQVAEEALKAGCGFIHRDSTDTLSQAYAGSDNWGSGPPGTAVSVGKSVRIAQKKDVVFSHISSTRFLIGVMVFVD